MTKTERNHIADTLDLLGHHDAAFRMRRDPEDFARDRAMRIANREVARYSRDDAGLSANTRRSMS